MLNDPIRREKYLLALKRKVNTNSVVLSVGECSLLGLIAACLGAKRVSYFYLEWTVFPLHFCYCVSHLLNFYLIN